MMRYSTSDQIRKIVILGTRGVPAQHGGFETFAEQLSLFLARNGWQVTVYCQEEGAGGIREDQWEGINRVIVPEKRTGPLGTVFFDWKSTIDAASRQEGIFLSLGYNTAIFFLIYRLKGRRNIVNMDGIEWKRRKWSLLERIWLYVNEKCGALLGNHLVADHPEIKKHLSKIVREGKITIIPYSSDRVANADSAFLMRFSLQPGRYVLLIARPEPENSILEIVAAFSRRLRGMLLVVLGRYETDDNPYHQMVMTAAGSEVRFIGPQYETSLVQALRFYSRLYVHGHTVGGTNPSLVEALGAGSPVLAHDNRFNRWVAGEGARYFSTEDDCACQLDAILDNESLVREMQRASRRQHESLFTHERVLGSYENLLKSQMFQQGQGLP